MTLGHTEPKAARAGYGEGFEEGRREGLAVGQRLYGSFFEGTSIIIPTYNRRQMLQNCIDSILRYTDLPYEIIVVDNASNDGTAAYLKSLRGQVRYRLLDTNRGFPGAANVGLTMAKGTTILLLHDDTLVTQHWLHNMLNCLDSDPRIGMVGPVEAGDRHIHVSRRRTRDMTGLTRTHHLQDAKKWRQTDRLTGFCMLLRRELFDQVGFFDEGFETGSYDDADYSLRVRLLGKQLVIAADTFVHHFGNLSTGAPADGSEEINARNRLFFLEKWNETLNGLENAWDHLPFAHDMLPHMAVYYPERIMVQAMGPTVYWIENGERHQVRGTVSIAAVRVSQVDLRRWPLGEPVDYEEPEREFRGLLEPGGRLFGVVKLPDGTPYHLEGGKVRRIVSQSAMAAWNLHLKPVSVVSPDELSAWETGLPIIAPPLLRQLL